MPKIIFFGSHDFGAAMLRCLLEYKKIEVVAVVTQPDRRVGKNPEPQPTLVKKMAVENNITVLTPETLKDFSFDFERPNLAVVCEYGLIIPERILNFPLNGSINVHTSLLPKYRGASPIQSAILNGEDKTGITIMLMDKLMDHGPILAQQTVDILSDESNPALREKMKPVAGKLLLQTLEQWINGKISPIAQNEDQASFCKMLTREDGKINWKEPKAAIYNRFRALLPWPGTWTTWKEKRLKLLKIRPGKKEVPSGKVEIMAGTLRVGCKDGSIVIEELQLEGKKPMNAEAFITGYSSIHGAILQ